MIRKLFSCAIVVFLALSLPANAQIPNGDFTNWAADSLGRMDPVGWESSNIDLDSATVLQDVDRIGGVGYSAKIVSVYDSSQADYFGGSLSLVHAPFTGAIRPSMVYGYWNLYDPSNASILIMDVQMFDSLGNQIGDGGPQAPTIGGFPNWTAFSSSITYTTNDPVATYSIDIFFVNVLDDPLIYCHIDDLSFDVSTTIEESQKKKLNCKIYSSNNIGIYSLKVEDIYNSKLNIDILDLNGREVKKIYEGTKGGENRLFDIDLSSENAGVYLCRIVNEKGLVKTLRLIK